MPHVDDRPHAKPGAPNTDSDYIIWNDATDTVLEQFNGPLVAVKKLVEAKGYTNVSLYQKVGTRVVVNEVVWK